MLEYLERALWLLGRLHPAVVHFPIAFLLALSVYIILVFFKKTSANSRVISIILNIATISAIIASIIGLLNAYYQDFSGDLAETLFWHKYLGIAVTVILIITQLLIRVKAKFIDSPFFLSLLAAGSLLLIISTHFGSVMVHGGDYLLEPMRETLPAQTLITKQDKKELQNTNDKHAEKEEHQYTKLTNLPTPIQKVIDFDHDIKPIFEQSCAKCHLAGKKKGDLQLDSREKILKGGESGPAVVVGDSLNSLLVQLIAGADAERKMPKKASKLSDQEIGTIRAWIDQGLKWGKEIDDKKLAKVSVAPRRPELTPNLNPELNPIDNLLQPYYEKHGVTLSEDLNDALFMRRVSLDLVGLLPEAEQLKTFIQSREPGKREELVDSLLADDVNYAAHWITFWNDLLRNDYTGVGFTQGIRQEITDWLYKALLNNLPLDKFVQQLIKPSRETAGFMQGISWIGLVNPSERPELQAAQGIAQVFMGVNLKCTSCHDSFFEEWSLKDAYGLANAIGGKPLKAHECESPTSLIPAPSFLYPELGEIEAKAPRKVKREQLAKLVTSPQNGRFARAIVNRIWALLFGYGLIEPIDELDHKAWNADLLDWLATYFVEQNYDLKKLLRIIVTSNAYQRKALPLSEQPPKEYIFHAPYMRRMTAEQIQDAIFSLSTTVPPLTAGDLTRIINLVIPALEQRSKLQYVQGDLEQDSSLELKLDLKDSSTVWLSALAVRKGNTYRPVRESVGKKKKAANKPLLHLDWQYARLFDGKQNINIKDIASTKTYPWKTTAFTAGESELLPAFEITPNYYYQKLHRAPLFLAAYDFPKKGGRFEIGAKRAAESGKKPTKKVALTLFTGLPVRAGLLENTPLSINLGRPRREHVVSKRSAESGTLLALDLINGEELFILLKAAANKMLQSNKQNQLEDKLGDQLQDQLINKIYWQLLSRAPTTREMEIAKRHLNSNSKEDGLADLLWATLMSPEFIFIG